ncbi:membrane-anchored mycosin MYCP [Mycobacterium sp. MAA66]|uniref:type VII secretion-associated serine protease mycosin n=1 Tax=Mycobacterium sp. MAA66 TaxID=3156297 RepID=UPI0035199F4D
MTRPQRLAAVLMLLYLTAPAPQAVAVAPPPVERSYLPPATAPTPPGPTEQSGRCAAAPAAKSTAGEHLPSWNLSTVWPLSRGAGQTVAVIDTGVARHRLLPHLLPAGDYVSSGDGTQDCDGHGTAVAGIIGSAPLGSFGGIAPESTIMAIRQSSNRFRLTADRSTSGLGDVDTLARAVRTAADAGATVINISSVACQPVTEPLDDRALGAALAYAVDVRNVVVVAAAGNLGGGCDKQNAVTSTAPDWEKVESVVSPAWYDDYVLTVGSVRADGAASQFSLAGPWVDVAAPGEDVVSLATAGDELTDTRPDDAQRRPLSGTSYAAPVASGVVALVRSRSPHLTAHQVMARIKDTARHPAGGWNPRVGHGVVDALAAVSADGPGLAAAAAAPQPAHPGASRQAVDPLPRRIAVVGTVFCVVVALALRALRLRTHD